MATVIFLSGTTMGDALGGIGRSQKDVYSNLGYDFVEVPLSQPEWPDVMDRTSRDDLLAIEREPHGAHQHAQAHDGPAYLEQYEISDYQALMT